MIPKFCPNPHCHFHQSTPPELGRRWFSFAGFYMTRVVGRVTRFRCHACGRSFSERTFSIDYYTKRRFPYRELLTRVSSSESSSAIARNLHTSVNLVINREGRLARNCLAYHIALEHRRPLSENLVADGFESFDRSQYFPNHVSIVVGKTSQELYAFAHATLRRKGRMTEAQKTRRALIDRLFRPRKQGLERSFASCLSPLVTRWDRRIQPRLELVTDKHQGYPRALAMIPRTRDPGFAHRAVASTLPRTVDNPLFPVNYFDRELRKDIAAYHRESTCFVRNIANGLNRLSIYLVWHNYLKPHRVHNGSTQAPVHAVIAGVKEVSIREAFSKLFTVRAFLSRVETPLWARRVWLRGYPTPLKLRPEYLPRFASV